MLIILQLLCVGSSSNVVMINAGKTDRVRLLNMVKEQLMSSKNNSLSSADVEAIVRDQWLVRTFPFASKSRAVVLFYWYYSRAITPRVVVCRHVLAVHQ
jgi:hypothetical protein